MKTPCEGFGCDGVATTCDRHVSRIGDAVWNAAIEAAAMRILAIRQEWTGHGAEALYDGATVIRALKREAK